MAENILAGGEFLVKDSAPASVFTPEDFTDEQKQIGKTTEEFITNEVLPHIEEIDHQDFDLLKALIKKAAELGLMMVDVPEVYGGLDLDKASSMLVAEKLGVSGAFATAFLAHTGIGTLPLVYYGSPEQKERYLEKLMSGEYIGAYCLTEPGSGSDALSVRTSATLTEDGSSYLLNGTKQFISNGGFADLFTVFAKIDKEQFTAFLVERDTTGLTVGPEEHKLGIKGSSTTQVIFDNVKVPVENLLGEVGKGHKIAFNILNIGRFKLGAGVTGAAKLAFDVSVQYANDRKQFNAPISSFGAIKEKLADMTADIFASESVVYRLAGLLDARLETLDRDSGDSSAAQLQVIEEYAAECAISKVYCSDVLAFVVDEVLQIHGGYGFIDEYPAERFYRDARISRIYEGTNEINRLLIPGTFLRKAMTGKLPLMQEAQKLFDQLTNSSPEANPAPEGQFAMELALLQRLKQLWIAGAGVAMQSFGPKIETEQELLLASADAAIQVFALESAVLRAEKMRPALSASRQPTVDAVVKVCAHRATEQCATALRKAAYYAAEGPQLDLLLKAVARMAVYDARGLLPAKRALAGAVIDTGGYVF